MNLESVIQIVLNKKTVYLGNVILLDLLCIDDVIPIYFNATLLSVLEAAIA